MVDLPSLKPARVPDYGQPANSSPVRGGSFLGVAFSADSRLAYLSNGDKGRIIVFDVNRKTAIDSISLDRAGASAKALRLTCS